jgi:zinc transporter ZupT
VRGMLGTACRDEMNGPLAAGMWGLVGGSALLLGAAIAYVVALSQRVIAAVMAIGSGVLIGNLALADASPDLIAGTTAVAAGAILAMLVDTMIPEATQETHEHSGLITVAASPLAFMLSKLGG